MNNSTDLMKICMTVALAVSGIVSFSQAGFALPEDANQETAIEGGSLELYPDQGLYIIRENADGLAHIKQGSMEIFGSEIRLEIIDNVLNKATAIGTPARFQQQPTIDQAIVHLSGQTLDYDNTTRMLNIDGDAMYSQGGNTVNGVHIDYHLDSRDVNATGGDGENVKMRLTPATVDTP